ncbi:MAG: sulfite exporter TauE/SafE family protein [Gammaproteobacteria bacterium]|nr:sulfite exporter TauE/SafE family protein [Gammaproteobacteria bacterium]
MNLETLFFILLGAFAGGFVNGFAGFGTSLFSLGWWLQVMPPLEAVATSLIMALVSGFQGMLLVRNNIDWPVLLRFLVPALAGIPIGLVLLSYLNSTVLTLLVASFLIMYGGFFSIKRKLPNLTTPTPKLDVSVGFAGGILGAVAGLSGALPTVLCSMRPWPKLQQRALLQPFNYIILGLSAFLLIFKGAYTASAVKTMIIAFPVTLLASLLGMLFYQKVNDAQFRRLLISLMLVSGILLILRTL